MIHLVCFDLGRVLVRICDGWRHACEVNGVPLPAAELSPAQRAAMLELIHRVEIGADEPERFCQAVARQLGVSCENVARAWDGYHLGTFPGATEMIEALRAAKVRTACLSNTNARHWEILNSPTDVYRRVLERLDWRFASHLIGARKPDPATYAYVEKETGFKGQEILFFDDMAENVEAAKARGWNAHLVPHCDEPVAVMREVIGKEVLSAE